MRIYRISYFSNLEATDRNMLEKIIKELDSMDIEDFDIDTRIPRDSVSIVVNKNPVVYIPNDYEYSQYSIDDFVRSLNSGFRSNTVIDRNIYKMTFNKSFTLTQLIKLVKYIIKEEEFCILLDNQ